MRPPMNILNITTAIPVQITTIHPSMILSHRDFLPPREAWRTLMKIEQPLLGPKGGEVDQKQIRTISQTDFYLPLKRRKEDLIYLAIHPEGG